MKIAIIGAGAAGLMAAGRLIELGASVSVFEKSKYTARKLGITGKGRCNLTNNCDLQTTLANIPTNPRFMYSALSNFSCEDVIALFESLGVPLKTERANRVFPVSDKARDVVFALNRYAKGARIIFSAVKKISHENGKFAVYTDRAEYFDKVLICTGGKSYPLTGSTGDGYVFAKELGHTIVEPRASLVPLEIKENYCKQMQGISLKNVSVSAYQSQKKIFEDFGEMMFTHFGVTGPIILSLSAHLPKIEPDKYRISIDLKPALDNQTLDSRLQREFSAAPNKAISNIMGTLLPSGMIQTFLKLAGIPADKKANSITKAERTEIIRYLKDLPLTVTRARPIEEAIITSGGVSVKEIDPKTMQSKIVKGLYFAGEVIDVDAYTGGFNLQIAWSTARLAADSIFYDSE